MCLLFAPGAAVIQQWVSGFLCILILTLWDERCHINVRNWILQCIINTQNLLCIFHCSILWLILMIIIITSITNDNYLPHNKMGNTNTFNSMLWVFVYQSATSRARFMQTRITLSLSVMHSWLPAKGDWIDLIWCWLERVGKWCAVAINTVGTIWSLKYRNVSIVGLLQLRQFEEREQRRKRHLLSKFL